jgi:asparagine synthase (glutamine-hydrolysing)
MFSDLLVILVIFLIHLYNKGGIQFMCENLYGVFAFILFDTNLKKVYFGRDTFGVRPAFKLTTETNTLAICSEAKGLLNLKLNNQIKPKITMVEPGTYEEYNLIEEPSKTRNGLLRHLAIFQSKQKFHVIGTFPKYDVNVKYSFIIFYVNIFSNVYTTSYRHY